MHAAENYEVVVAIEVHGNDHRRRARELLHRELGIAVCCESTAFGEALHVEQREAAPVSHPLGRADAQHGSGDLLLADRVTELIGHYGGKRRRAAANFPFLDDDVLLTLLEKRAHWVGLRPGEHRRGDKDESDRVFHCRLPKVPAGVSPAGTVFSVMLTWLVGQRFEGSPPQQRCLRTRFGCQPASASSGSSTG
jgi:hypothetical protein